MSGRRGGGAHLETHLSLDVFEFVTLVRATFILELQTTQDSPNYVGGLYV
jgi:hypothetical protein